MRVDQFELNYRIEGAGRDVIVVGSTVYYPRTLSAHLREHLRLIFMDHRGFGAATAPFTDADFELDVLVEDIEKMRRELNLDKVVMMGHSGHGYMALAYAKRYPQHVSHLVLLAQSPASSSASFAAADRYLEESVCPERKALLAEQLALLDTDIQADPNRRFIHYSLRSAPKIWYDYRYDSRHLWEGVTVIPEMFDYVWGKLFRTIDIADGLDRLTMPVFLGLGRYDYWNPPHLWEAVRDRFADLRIRVFEKSGHTPQLEEPDRFDAELLGWLAEKDVQS
ncbi:MAG: alpha/beta hydrolase [Anaerolineae bacterium]|nr:alpha/beta hydrolase [Anaerolineae bacterium]